METARKISVLVVNQSLENQGIIANTAFVLGLTVGREISQDTFGEDVVDADGSCHKYLTKIGHYVRKAGQNKIRTLRSALAAHPEVSITDYTEDAAPADYQAYSTSLASHSGEDINYRALHVYGPEEIVAPLTKNLSKL
jgi:hypothetical protein